MVPVNVAAPIGVTVRVWLTLILVEVTAPETLTEIAARVLTKQIQSIA